MNGGHEARSDMLIQRTWLFGGAQMYPVNVTC